MSLRDVTKSEATSGLHEVVIFPDYIATKTIEIFGFLGEARNDTPKIRYLNITIIRLFTKEYVLALSL